MHTVRKSVPKGVST